MKWIILLNEMIHLLIKNKFLLKENLTILSGKREK
jgi:hypothetical protein